MGAESKDLVAITLAEREVDSLKLRTEAVLAELNGRVQPVLAGIRRVVEAPARLRARIRQHPVYFAMLGVGLLAAAALLAVAVGRSRRE